MAPRSYPVRRHSRLPAFDYSTAGMYFVTVCTQNRLPLLGTITGSRAILTPAGEMVRQVWDEMAHRYHGVFLDSRVVMPNHFHALILLDPQSGPEGSSLSLSDVIHRFKSFTTTRYGVEVKQHRWPPYAGRLWQQGFFDRVVRRDEELDATRRYIEENPERWDLDEDNPDRIAD